MKPTGAPFYHRPWTIFSSVELGMEPGYAPMCPLSSSWLLTVGWSHNHGGKPGAVKSYKAGFAGTKGGRKLVPNPAALG